MRRPPLYLGVLAMLLLADLGACGGGKKAVPAEVELQWPDAAVFTPSHSPGGQGQGAAAIATDAMPTSPPLEE